MLFLIYKLHSVLSNQASIHTSFAQTFQNTLFKHSVFPRIQIEQFYNILSVILNAITPCDISCLLKWFTTVKLLDWVLNCCAVTVIKLLCYVSSKIPIY